MVGTIKPCTWYMYFFFSFFFFLRFIMLCIWVHCSCTDGFEPSCGCWEFRTSARSGWPHPVDPACSGQLCSLSPCSLWPKDLFITIHKYTVAVFRRTRRGSQISLQVVVSHHVVPGIELRISGRTVTDLNCWEIFPVRTWTLIPFY